MEVHRCWKKNYRLARSGNCIHFGHDLARTTQLQHFIQDAIGKQSLRHFRQLLCGVAVKKRDGVAIGIEADLRAGNVVQHDRVHAFAGQLIAGMFQRVLCFCGKSDRPVCQAGAAS